METYQSKAPISEPISIDQAKRYLLLDADVATDDQDLVASLITGARQYCENYCDRAFVEQTWVTTMDAFLSGVIIPGGEIKEIDSITYIGHDGSTQTVSPDVYSVSRKGHLRLNPGKSWPAHASISNAIEITYEVGPTRTPQDVIQAMRLMIAHFYESRSETVIGVSVSKLPLGVSALLARHRVLGV